ncbi:MAG: Rne/Rng family ribonuclease [Proteobacteria bacterium]|nr:Rne/Rng family ribonuclease [Pseudomonadota bacterium]
MGSELIINVTSLETRVALLENGILAELHIERESDKGITGNIYKGKVSRVLPGMQAAFVDIGLSRSAFLYVVDVYRDDKEFASMINGAPDAPANLELTQEQGDIEKSRISPPIEDLLTEGQEVIVQVVKEPIGSKGSRISSHISLPGRYIVYMPMVNHIGISRRIEDEDERNRLKEIVKGIKPADAGLIIRTASEGSNEEELSMDMDFLFRVWENIQKRSVNAPVTSLIHEDLSISLRAIRDLYSKDVERVIVDSRSTYDSIIEFIETYMPQLKYSVEYYDREEPIFDAYGVEVEISRALGKRIWLKSGGYIVIEETEALVAIDVNTGRFVGKGNPEDTIFKTNLEALKEIAYQIRLRNLGGIIIIDFIDMEKESDREKILQAFREALSKDRAKSNILSISELGLIEMTRKRVRENLSRKMGESCPYCEGRGTIRSTPSLCYDILRAIRREAMNSLGSKIIVLVHPDVATFLYDEERNGIEELERQIKKKIIIKIGDDFHHEQSEIYSQ